MKYLVVVCGDSIRDNYSSDTGTIFFRTVEKNVPIELFFILLKNLSNCLNFHYLRLRQSNMLFWFENLVNVNKKFSSELRKNLKIDVLTKRTVMINCNVSI